MLTHVATRPTILSWATTPANRLSGMSALALGASGLVYSLSFVVVKHDALTAAMLAASGLLSLVLFGTLYDRLRATDATLARLTLILGLLGATGALLHGGHDLANALHPPATPNLDLPSAIDPRGLLTFGVDGLAVALVATLLGRDAAIPRILVWLGFLTATLMVVLYISRLVILDATHPLIAITALVTGFVASPAWNIWLGATLLRERQP